MTGAADDSSPQPTIRPTTSAISIANRWDHVQARCGVNRGGHRVAPGLYGLGNPTPDSPVFVTANYTLSFDALRSALAGRDGYILVPGDWPTAMFCAIPVRTSPLPLGLIAMPRIFDNIDQSLLPALCETLALAERSGLG